MGLVIVMITGFGLTEEPTEDKVELAEDENSHAFTQLSRNLFTKLTSTKV